MAFKLGNTAGKQQKRAGNVCRFGRKTYFCTPIIIEWAQTRSALRLPTGLWPDLRTRRKQDIISSITKFKNKIEWTL